MSRAHSITSFAIFKTLLLIVVNFFQDVVVWCLLNNNIERTYFEFGLVQYHFSCTQSSHAQPTWKSASHGWGIKIISVEKLQLSSYLTQRSGQDSQEWRIRCQNYIKIYESGRIMPGQCYHHLYQRTRSAVLIFTPLLDLYTNLYRGLNVYGTKHFILYNDVEIKRMNHYKIT